MKSESFWRWLLRRFRFLSVPLAFLPIIPYVYKNLSNFAVPTKDLVTTSFLIQMAVICLYVIWLFSYVYFGYIRKDLLPLRKDLDPEKNKLVRVAQAASEQFTWWFIGLLGTWMILYFYLWQYSDPSAAPEDLLGNILNNLSSCLLLACYYTLAFYTVSEPTPGSESKNEIQLERRVALVASFVILVVFTGVQKELEINKMATLSKFLRNV